MNKIRALDILIYEFLLNLFVKVKSLGCEIKTKKLKIYLVKNTTPIQKAIGSKNYKKLKNILSFIYKIP